MSVTLVTYASPSHKEMCDRFVIGTGEAAGFASCIVYNDEQKCLSGDYASDGFDEQCWRKIASLTKLPIGTRALYVDADCLLFPGLAAWCDRWLDEQPNTIGHSNDAGQFCAGVMLWTQTQETIDWLKFVWRLAWMIDRNDQEALLSLMGVATNYPVSLAKLPHGVFANWSYGGDLSLKTWQGEPLVVPENMLLWHSNFCIGVESKLKMLDTVEKHCTITTD